MFWGIIYPSYFKNEKIVREKNWGSHDIKEGKIPFKQKRINQIKILYFKVVDSNYVNKEKMNVSIVNLRVVADANSLSTRENVHEILTCLFS